MSDVYEQWDAQDREIELRINDIRYDIYTLEQSFGVDIEIEHWDRYTNLYSFLVHTDDEVYGVFGTVADLEERL